MCYGVYISTDSDEDLTERNSQLVRFQKAVDAGANPCVRLLEFANKWYVGSESECSCTFRHLESIELGFGEPEDWSPEEPDEIEATYELYAILTQLLMTGYKVDLMDLWEGGEDQTTPEQVKAMDVSLDEVPPKAFRLFSAHRFRLTKERSAL